MNSPEKVNLVADKIAFVNKISTLLKATSDDDKPVPGYLYKEISDISHESMGYCESLLEYLTDRLEKDSYHVKLKVLKVMRYTVDNGHPNFKIGLMRMARGVRAATKYGGPPDPLHGNVPYIMVRKVAQELCEVLFNVEETETGRSRETTPSKPPAMSIVGIGPTNTSGRMQGFGNSPQNQEKSLGETIIDGISKIAEKMSETESDRQRAVLASLEGSSGQYRPPVIIGTDPVTADSVMPPPVISPVTRAPPKHIPGRAGGGWEDDPEPPTQKYGSEKKHSGSGGSSDLADRLESVTVEDWRLEEQLVTSVVEDNSRHLLTPSQLITFHRKCAGLNSEKVLEFIIHKLSTDQEDVIMRPLLAVGHFFYMYKDLPPEVHVLLVPKESVRRKHHTSKCLLLLETYLRSDLVNLEYLASVSEQSLVSVHNQWSGPPHSKARKIIRILEKLTSHTKILPCTEENLINTETNIPQSVSHQLQLNTPKGDNSGDLESLSSPQISDNLGLTQESLLDMSDGLS